MPPEFLKATTGTSLIGRVKCLIKKTRQRQQAKGTQPSLEKQNASNKAGGYCVCWLQKKRISWRVPPKVLSKLVGPRVKKFKVQPLLDVFDDTDFRSRVARYCISIYI